MQDIRVDDGFFGHPKTVRFFRRTGDHGIACLFRLWCYTSMYFPKGILAGMSDQEISEAAGWKNDPNEFISALIEAGGPGKAGFLDRCETHCGLHNWRTRNPYAYFREERSDVARKAAETRWEKKRKPHKKQDSNAKGNADSNAKRNAPSPAPAPNPFPSPDKKASDLSKSVGLTDGANDGGNAEGHPPAAPPPRPKGNGVHPKVRALNLPPEKEQAVAGFYQRHQAEKIRGDDISDTLRGAGLDHSEIMRVASLFIG